MLLGPYRLVVGAEGSWAGHFVAGLGFGMCPSCIRGDMCGGGGPATTVEGALRRRLGRRTTLLVGLELRDYVWRAIDAEVVEH